MLPEKYRYIVVEGPIGAGKTSLARRLSEHVGKSLLLEDPDSNPFLARFYEDQRRYALATQLFFLFQRAQQVAGLKQIELFDRVRKRAVAYERNISEQYLSRLADAYRRFFYQFSAAPLLIVNSDHLNFVDDANDFDLLLRRISEMRGPREFFSRGE